MKHSLIIVLLYAHLSMQGMLPLPEGYGGSSRRHSHAARSMDDDSLRRAAIPAQPQEAQPWFSTITCNNIASCCEWCCALTSVLTKIFLADIRRNRDVYRENPQRKYQSFHDGRDQ